MREKGWIYLSMADGALEMMRTGGAWLIKILQIDFVIHAMCMMQN